MSSDTLTYMKKIQGGGHASPHEIGKKYGLAVLSAIPKMTKKQAQYFGKGFTEVGKSIIDAGVIPNRTKMVGAGKRKTAKYCERMGRILAEDIGDAHPELIGSGFFDDVWNGLKSAGKWIGKNIIHPVASAVSAVAEPLAKGAEFLFPEFAPAIEGVKDAVVPIAGTLSSLTSNISDDDQPMKANTTVKKKKVYLPKTPAKASAGITKTLVNNETQEVPDYMSTLTGNGSYGLGQLYGSAIQKEHPELKDSVATKNFVDGLHTVLNQTQMLPPIKGKGKTRQACPIMKRRAAAVKKIMKERKVSLGQASRIVKEENIKY